LDPRRRFAPGLEDFFSITVRGRGQNIILFFIFCSTNANAHRCKITRSREKYPTFKIFVTQIFFHKRPISGYKYHMRIVEIVSPEEQPAQSQIQNNPEMLRNLADLWQQFAKDNPRIKYALDMLPVTGPITSGVDASAYVQQGEYGPAAVAALGIIPGVKPLLKLSQMGLTARQLALHRRVTQSSSLARNTDRGVDSAEYMQNKPLP